MHPMPSPAGAPFLAELLCFAFLALTSACSALPSCPTTLTAGAPFLTELLCFAFLAYPCACAYYSVYR